MRDLHDKIDWRGKHGPVGLAPDETAAWVLDRDTTFDLDPSVDYPGERHAKADRSIYNVIDWTGQHRGQIALTRDERNAINPLGIRQNAVGWRPVDRLMTEMQPGDQWDVLFGRPAWSWPILGVVSHMRDHLDWSAYDQQNDKFIKWDSEAPTVYVRRPELPPLGAASHD